MKRKTVVIALMILCIILGVYKSAYAFEDKGKGIILIDPGHGGVDGGAKGKSGTDEKNINLVISEKLKKSLEETGYKVYMTRENDKELSTIKRVDLETRCKMKRETNCDVFISIHQNKFNSEKCFGAQVWYASNTQSSALAISVQEALKNSTEDNNKRLAKAAGEQYKILRDGYDGASIIVECGFLSNYEEEQRLKSEEHQQKVVKGIVCGIEKYFEEKK